MMKVRLITITIVYAFCIAAHAQISQDGYQPFVEEGKVWEKQVGLTRENTFDNYIEGDTLINGEIWKKVFNHGEFGLGGGNIYYLALREEGKKVYAIAKGSKKPRLLYDFDLKVGDELKCGVEGNAFGCLRDRSEKPDTLLGFLLRKSLKVRSIDTIHVSGSHTRENYLRRFHLDLLDAFGVPETDREVVWVEGVGAVAYPFQPWEPMPVSEYDNILFRCSVDRQTVFSFLKEFGTTSVSGHQYQTSGSSGFYNLQGRSLSGQPQKGIYIQNGKKILR